MHVIFENGGGEIFVSLNTLQCVNVALGKVRLLNPFNVLRYSLTKCKGLVFVGCL